MLTAERLREVLTYDPQSGEFRRRVDRGRGRGRRWKAGTIAGRKAIYVHVSIDGVLHAAHRLAWLYMTGEWPSHGIDHVDQNKHNNVWSNLRAANKSQNAMNSKVRSTNTSGFVGVSRNHARFMANIGYEGRTHYLGTFDTAEEAHAAYLAAAAKLHGEFMPRQSATA